MKPKAVKRRSRDKELIKLYGEYIVLLGLELDEVVPLAYMHGWKSTRYEQGKKLRKQIE